MWLRHWNIHYVGSNDAFLSEKKHKEWNRNTDRKKYLLEFAGGFVIQVPKFHANSLDKFIRAYLSNYFNALGAALKIDKNDHSVTVRLALDW